MIFLIFLGVILFLTLFGLIYLALFLPTKWTIKKRHLKTVRLSLSILITILIVAYNVFIPVWSNDKLVTIEKADARYVVTMTGKRALMVHDPISMLQRETYLKTFKLIIPRADGIINASEIPQQDDFSEMFGVLNINHSKMKMNFYYDTLKKSPYNWNGEYNISWKNDKVKK